MINHSLDYLDMYRKVERNRVEWEKKLFYSISLKMLGKKRWSIGWNASSLKRRLKINLSQYLICLHINYRDNTLQRSSLNTYKSLALGKDSPACIMEIAAASKFH